MTAVALIVGIVLLAFIAGASFAIMLFLAVIWRAVQVLWSGK